KLDYSVFLYSIGNSTPSSAQSLQSVLMTYNKDEGNGSFNRGRYSNPAFDAKVKEALAEFDDAKRQKILEEATAIAFNDHAILPLYWQRVYWASKATLDYTPSRREDTLAMNAKLAK